MPRHLGNFATIRTRSVNLMCDDCDVEWTGCAAENCCPICGRPQDHWKKPLNISPLPLPLPRRKTKPSDKSGADQ
jgi:hypothetical protein